MAQGKMVEAEGYFREAIEIQIGQIETIFAALPLRDREIFYARVRDDVDRYNYIAFGLLDQKPELIKNIFDYQIKTKTLLFTPSGKIEGRIVNGNDQNLRNQFFEWRNAKQLLANYYRIGEQRLQENNIRLEDVESDVLAKEQGLISNMEEFSSILPKTGESWNDVLGKVNPNEAVVELVKIREFKSQENNDGIIFGFTNLTQYLAIIFKNGASEPTYVVLGNRFRYEDDQLDVYKSAVARGNENEAFDLMWGPVHNQLGNVNRVRVTSDGIYHQINPNSFKSGSNKYLIDDYFVTYMTSCKDLFRDNTEALSKKSVLVGNPDFKGSAQADRLNLSSLITSELEINSIAALLQPKNWDSRVYAKGDASELRIRSAYNPTLLHIATHGFFSREDEFFSAVTKIEDPMFRSGLFLSGASKSYDGFINGFNPNELNDGILTTYEAMGLDLNRTKLVVLSAPEPNVPQIENREGIYGLQRAFVVAGARNLLTNFSRGNANAMSELIVLFYHKFIETEDASESLRFAQQKLRTKYDDPRVWGSFMLVGNG